MSPLRATLAVVCAAVSFAVVSGPIAASRFPPMTDLPFHAAHASILRHYWDPAWHFHEQFELHPIAVPYLLHYAVAAAFMLFMKPLAAVKTATVVMLLCVPAGMAVLLRGMKRSATGAVLSLPLAYCTLTHWGFVSYVAALGLFAAAIGFAMMVVDRPTPGRRIALGVTLALLFFAHIFRFPMAIAAVVGTAIVLYPATRRLRPIVAPVLPSLALFVVWWFVRPRSLEAGAMELHVDLDRAKEIWPNLFAGFVGGEEKALAGLWGRVAAFVASASLLAAAVSDRWGEATARERRFAAGAAVIPVVCAAAFLGLFFTLPIQIGVWWYVYPREATAAVYMGLAALPGLPRRAWARAPLVAMAAGAAIAFGAFVTRSYAAFNAATDDFTKIAAQIPKAPRLMYLVFDHGGSNRASTPFIHLPAYIQAERGGYLGFNFAWWNAAPMMFRAANDPIAVLPPRTPTRWEWQPNLFKVREHGAFFDWFLVRSVRSADAIFQDDPTIERVDHVGTWWLYRRVRGRR